MAQSKETWRVQHQLLHATHACQFLRVVRGDEEVQGDLEHGAHVVESGGKLEQKV